MSTRSAYEVEALRGLVIGTHARLLLDFGVLVGSAAVAIVVASAILGRLTREPGTGGAADGQVGGQHHRLARAGAAGSSRDSSIDTATRPACSIGAVSVVSGGLQKSAPKMSSQPTMLMSSGHPDAALAQAGAACRWRAGR